MTSHSALTPDALRSAALLCVFLLVGACSTGSSTQKQSAQNQQESMTDSRSPSSSIDQKVDAVLDELDGDHDFAVLYAQNGEFQPVEDNVVELAPQPFRIYVISKPGVGALVNISRDPTNKERVLADRELSRGLGAPGTGMAEHPFNKKQHIMLGSPSSNYWIYQDDSQHRFDDVRQKDGWVIGSRIVKSVFDTDADKEYPVEEFGGQKLHVIEFDTGQKMQVRPPKRAYTIQFRDN